MGHDSTRRCGYFTAFVCALGLAGAPPASATASLSLSSELASGLTVGKEGLAGSITVTNTSTAPQNQGAGALVLASLKLVPACGQAPLAVDCPPDVRDPGALALSAGATGATGATGTACAGVPFAVSTLDAAQGKVQFVPSSPVLLAAGRPGQSPSCRVAFTFDVLRMPTFDADLATAGMQTARIAVASANHTDGVSTAATINPQISATIAPGTVAISGSADGGLIINTPTSDSATLVGTRSAPAMTGTITFSLHGPQDSTCTETPLFTLTEPVTGGGTYASGPFTPTVPGIHRWTASYSGDANNAPASTACSDRDQAVSVRAAIVVTGPTSRVGRLGATLTGSVNIGGASIPTTYVFEYGPTLAYGSQTPVQPLGPGAAAVPAATILTGLRAGARYHYRLVATHPGGSVTGTDRTFTTRPKATASRLSVNVHPQHDRRPPYRFAFRGKLVLPSSVAAVQGCVGSVVIRVTIGKRTVAATRAALTRRCNYARRLTVPRRAPGERRLTATVSFYGNRVVKQIAGARRIRAG